MLGVLGVMGDDWMLMRGMRGFEDLQERKDFLSAVSGWRRSLIRLLINSVWNCRGLVGAGGYISPEVATMDPLIRSLE